MRLWYRSSHHQQVCILHFKVQQQQHRLSMERQNLYTDCEVKLQQCQLQYEGRLMAEKYVCSFTCTYMYMYVSVDKRYVGMVPTNP